MAAAVTLLRLPLARLSYHLRSVPSSRLPSPRLRIFASHRLFSSLDHGSASASASAAVAEVVGVPDAEEESVEEESAAEAEAEAPRSFVLPRLPRPKLSVKERKELASYAHGLGKKLKSQQVGKSGVTPNLVSAFSDNLESNELLKVCPHWPSLIAKSTMHVVFLNTSKNCVLSQLQCMRNKPHPEIYIGIRKGNETIVRFLSSLLPHDKGLSSVTSIAVVWIGFLAPSCC
jgi:hypothetical protein